MSPAIPAYGSWDTTKRLQLQNYYGSKRVLVTGGASFIGSHLVELLLEAGATVTVADDLSSGHHGTHGVDSRVRFVRGDLRESDIASRVCGGQSVVFHLAAAHGGRGYIESHPVECLNNMLLDHTVFAAAAASGAEKVVYASSACVYPVNLQASESDRLLLKEADASFDDPGKAYADGEYGWAKLMGELQLRAFHRQVGISGIAARIFTAYGERENETHAVIALIAKAAARMDPYPVWGTGAQTRNFTYVGDTVMGLALAGALLNGFETINVGGSSHYTVLQLVEEIFRHLDWRPRELRFETNRPVGVKSRAADNTKCRALLGWEPGTGLAEGVARTTDWYTKRLGFRPVEQFERLLMER
jgi:nucleoside-diphosphate-sugar epimerase